MKLMSLFDGSGGFPLAASLCGIKPIYAAEVEPYPIAVTKNRFPKMKHLGDVSKVKGGEIEPVDIITFGSPCQDMSIAGKRAGLKHADMGDDETTRSGLFLEAIRIIKEMREATNGVYPRYAIWENVPGAFSSNRGEDFRTVLEEFIRVKEKDAVMPDVPKAGWPYADCYSGNGWSLAYRVFDAQYWGVPQRRRRIYLVADFRGQRAGEILLKPEGLRRNSAQSGTQGQETARCAKNSVGTAIGGDCTPTVLAPVAVYCHQGNGIGADDNDRLVFSFDSLSSNSMKSSNPHSGCRSVKIAKTLDTSTQDPSKNQGGIAVIEKYVYDTRGNGDGETVPTITGDHNNRVTDYTCLAITRCYDIGEARLRTPSEYIEKSPTITARCGTGGNNVPAVVYDGANITSPLNKTNPQAGDTCHTLSTDSGNYIVYSLQGNGIDRADTAGCNGKGVCEDKCYTLNTIDRHAVCFPQQAYNKFIQEDIGATLKASGGTYGGGSENLVAEQSFSPIRYIVRRLTPTECARLQGFPDWWGEIPKKDNLTDDEYAFWLNVRNTYAKINNKTTKEYSKEQMLSWYNKLHSDSSEYKMWGNGIALPNALYVMQGIAEVERVTE